MKQNNIGAETSDHKLHQKIHARSAQLDWRKPAKVSGKLMQELIKALKLFPEVKAAYLTEVQVKGSSEGHIPLIAISAPTVDEVGFEKILSSVCLSISSIAELDSPFDVCRTEQFPEFENILKQGLARQFYLNP